MFLSTILLFIFLGTFQVVSASLLIPVKIDVSCSGVQVGSRSIEDLPKSAILLEEAYNRVHGTKYQEEHVTVLTETQWSGLYGRFSDAGRVEAEYTGYWACDECDIDAFLDEPTEDWESLFTVLLTTSANHAFGAVRDCKIRMNNDDKADESHLLVNSGRPIAGVQAPSPNLIGSVVQKDETTEQSKSVLVPPTLRPVVVQVYCDMIDFRSMSGNAITATAKALEIAYNSVHMDIDSHYLTHLVPSGFLIPVDRLPISSTGSTSRLRKGAPKVDWAPVPRVGFEFEGAWFAGMEDSNGETPQVMEDQTPHLGYRYPELHYAWEAVFLSRILYGETAVEYAGTAGCKISIKYGHS